MFEAVTAIFKKNAAPAPALGDETAWSESSMYSGVKFAKYNPDDLVSRKGFGIYAKMLTDEQIKAVVFFRRSAITSRQSFFACDHEALSPEENAARIKLFDTIVSKMTGAWGDVYNGIMSAMYQGFSLTEKIYAPLDIEGKAWIGIKRLKLRPANTFRFHVDEFGNIEKVTQAFGTREQEIDIARFIHYVQNPDVDEHYGQSELREAYRAWFSKDMACRFQNIHLERFAGGFAVAKPVTGKTIQPNSAEAIALQSVLSNLNGKTSVLLPAGMDLTVVNPATTDMFEKAIAQHDKSIAKALLVPNLMGISEQGSTGSFAQSQTQMEAFLWTLEADSKRLEEVLNEQLWKELGELNWGDGYYPELQFKPISEARKMDIITKWTTLVTGGAVKASAVDEEHIRNLLDFPQLAAEQTDNPTLLLNGAQVTALAGIIVQVNANLIASDAAIALILASFPLTEEQVARMVQPIPLAPGAAPKQPGLPAPATPTTAPPTTLPPPKSDAGSNLQDETIVGKSLVSVAAMSRAMKRVDFAVIANKADNTSEQYAHDIAVINSAAVARMMREAEELKLGTADGIPTDVLKIKFNADEQGLMKKAVMAALKDAWGIGEYHAKKELGKAAHKAESDGAAMTRTFATNDLALQDAAVAHYKLKAYTITGNITAATEQRIRNTLAEGIKVSHTFAETKKAIYKDLEGDGLLTEEAVAEALGTTTAKSTNARINTIMRTSTFEAINEARYEFFSDPALQGFVEALEFSAILDERVTEVCAQMDGMIYPIDDPVWQTFRPGLHYNCRSLLIPVTQNDTWTRSDDPTVMPQKGFGFHVGCNH